MMTSFARELHILMGEKIWTSFANYYARIARGNSNGLDAGIYTQDVMDWYNTHKLKMNDLCLKYESTNKDYHWTLWFECKEMWIDSTLEQRKDLLQLLRSKKFEKFNMYQIWNMFVK
jgi:hypothetical protein